MKYAADTSVSVAKSRAEIEEMVQRAGGAKFGTMLEPKRAFVIFELAQRRVMFELPLPDRSDFAKKKDRRGWPVTVSAEKQQQAFEQACRSRWRALYLCIKAKLVSVESKVESFEEAFLAQIVVPNGQGSARFGDLAIKAIAQAYSGEGLPPLLPSGGAS